MVLSVTRALNQSESDVFQLLATVNDFDADSRSTYAPLGPSESSESVDQLFCDDLAVFKHLRCA